jgi:hypothetical protein
MDPITFAALAASAVRKLGHLLPTEPQHVGDNISMLAGDNSTLIGKVQGDANFGTDLRGRLIQF